MFTYRLKLLYQFFSISVNYLENDSHLREHWLSIIFRHFFANNSKTVAFFWNSLDFMWKSVESWSTIIIEMCLPSECLFSPDFVVDSREKEFGVPWLNHQEEVAIAKLLFETEWCMSESRSPRKPYAVVGMLQFSQVQ